MIGIGKDGALINSTTWKTRIIATDLLSYVLKQIICWELKLGILQKMRDAGLTMGKFKECCSIRNMVVAGKMREKGQCI